MWVKKFSKIYQGIKPEHVWHIWADINQYMRWHDDLDYCKIDGAFTVGNFFMLKPKGAPAVKIYITELIENKKFVDCTHFFGAKMYDIHELELTPEGLKISNTIKVTGFLSLLWTQLVAKKVAASAEKEAEALVQIARKMHE